MLERLVRRIERHLRRCGLLGIDEDEAEPGGEGDPEGNLAASAVSGQTPPAGPQWVSRLAPLEPHALAYDKKLCASLDGFTLHAAARAGALQPAGREALLRYVLRPAGAQERVELRPDALVRITLKKAYADGTMRSTWTRCRCCAGWLVARHRERGVHMKATYICTTNDVLADVGVITAGGLVAWTGSPIPDLVIGTTIAAAVFRGALRILKPLAFVRQPSAPEVGPQIAGWARRQTDLGCLDAVSIGVSTLRVRRCPSVTLLTRQVLVGTRW